MKYIFFAYNLLTLSKAVRYTDEVFEKKNTIIIYSNFVSDIPEKIQLDYKIIFIESNLLNNGSKGLKLLYKTCQITNKVWKVIDDCIMKSVGEVTFIVFRDNELQEMTWIDRASKKYQSRISFWIMEEGAGLYALKKTPIKYKIIKKLFYIFTNVSCEYLLNYTQGMNPKIQKVICNKPENYLIKRNHNVEVEKMIDIFIPSFNDYFLKIFFDDYKSTEKFDYVFLTQPFHEFRSAYDKLIKIHNELLPIVLNELKKRGKVLIKLHPREQFDYSKFIGDKVTLATRTEQNLPFECLMQMYGNPQMISMFSSVCLDLKTEKPSIFIGEWFQIPGVENLFDEDFYINNDIIRCKNYEEFKNSLFK